MTKKSTFGIQPARQGSARLLESYGEQAGGGFGFQLAFGF